MPVDSVLNDNGKRLLAVCRDSKLLVVNNLIVESKSFLGALTFGKGNNWTSQLDLCVVSEDLIPCVSHFNIDQDTSFPSNHAPVSIGFTFPKETMSLQQILIRSADIGCYPEKPEQLCKRAIPIHRIDNVLFIENIEAVDPTLVITGDHNAVAKGFSDILYNTITQSKAPPPPPTIYDPAQTRWERIMNCEDHSILWKAIDQPNIRVLSSM